ncbi:MAG: ATP-grasp domain-containing protein [bacterium]|nr:ATP-grasp domain-containing protein [bacterium]
MANTENKESGGLVSAAFPTADASDPDAPRGYFLSLGAGRHQTPLIAAAHRLGFPVVAVDRDLKAPGFAHATVQLQCSITRPRRILEMLNESTRPIPVAGVGCRSFGRAGMTAAILAHAHNTPGNELRVLRRFQNKRRLKAQLALAGVPVPPAFACGTLAERDALRACEETLLVRPASGHGKFGLRLLTNQADRNRFLQIHLRDTGKLLIEALTPGQEVTVLGIVQHGRYSPICLSDKHVSQRPPLFIELGHDFPARISAQERADIDAHMQSIVDTTGLRHGPIVAEFILRESATNSEEAKSGRREALLVECAPEIGGEYLADVLVPAMLGDDRAGADLDSGGGRAQDRGGLHHRLDYFEELVRLYTGGVFRTEDFAAAIAEPKHQVSIRFLPQQAGTLESIALPENLSRTPGFLFAHLLKTAGAQTSLEGGNPDRLAVFGLRGPWRPNAPASDQEPIRELANQIARQIQDRIEYQ